MAKRAAVAAVGTPAGKKSLRKLKKARDAQFKAERQVGKLRIRLERAESKLARRAHKVGAIETRLAPHGPGAEQAAPATAPAAAKQARAKRGKKVLAAQQEEQRLEAIGLSAPVHADGASGEAAASHGRNNKGGQSAAPTIVLPDEVTPAEQDAE